MSKVSIHATPKAAVEGSFIDQDGFRFLKIDDRIGDIKWENDTHLIVRFNGSMQTGSGRKQEYSSTRYILLAKVGTAFSEIATSEPGRGRGCHTAMREMKALVGVKDEAPAATK